MGFDIIMKVVGECSPYEVLEKSQGYTVIPSPEKRLVINKWISTLTNISMLYKKSEIEFDDYYINITYWSPDLFRNVIGIKLIDPVENTSDLEKKLDEFNSKDAESSGSECDNDYVIMLDGFGKINKYVPWIYFQILINLLEEIENESSNSIEDISKVGLFEEYIKYINQLDDLNITSNKCKIYIHSEFSYKGSDRLNIDYEELQNKINTVTIKYSPGIDIYTKLTMK